MLDPREEYQLRYGVHFVDKLGEGKDGDILKTTVGAAVKFLRDDDLYRRENRAYRILKQLKITEVDGFQIPELLRLDDELRAIEMRIVQPPFLLDFASAYTHAENERFGFTEEVMAEREQHWVEVFGEKWAVVRELRDEFARRTGLVLLDLSLNNIRFG